MAKKSVKSWLFYTIKVLSCYLVLCVVLAGAWSLRNLHHIIEGDYTYWHFLAVAIFGLPFFYLFFVVFDIIYQKISKIIP